MKRDSTGPAEQILFRGRRVDNARAKKEWRSCRTSVRTHYITIVKKAKECRGEVVKPNLGGGNTTSDIRRGEGECQEMGLRCPEQSKETEAV